MRGFQPQNYADGGLVQGAKRFFGMDEEHNARIAAYRAQQAQEKAQQQAAQQQAKQAVQPAAPAVSDYASMGAMKRREKAAGLDYADGGMVRGPGTGTSDEVPDEVPDGTYIMPADSTQAVGADKLAGMGREVPVNLSNGEFKMPPEQVHAIGVQALDQVKEATHQPVRGFAPKAQPEEPRQFFSNGGLVEDESTKRPSSFGDAAAAAQNAGVTQVGGLANNGGADAARFAQVPAPIGTQPNRTPDQALQPPGAPAATPPLAAPPAVQSAPATAPLGQMHSAGSRSGVQMVADGLDGGTRAFFDSFQKAPAPPVPSPAQAPATARTDVQRGGGNVPAVTEPALGAPSGGAPSGGAPTMGAKPGTPEAQEVMAGVYQHGRGQYSDSASGMGFAPGFTGKPSAQSMAAADALAQRSQQESANRVTARGFAPGGFAPQAVQAPQVLHSGNSWQARNDLRNAEVSASSIMNNGGKWDQHGKGVVSPERMRLAAMLESDAKLRQAAPGVALHAAEASAKDATARYVSDNALSGNLADVQARGFDAQARRAIDGRKLNLEQQVRGFDIRQGQRQEQRQARYEAAKTPEERAAVAQQIRDLSGKQAESPWKLQVTPTTKNADGSTSEGSIVRYNAQTGQVERVDAGAKPSGPQAPKTKAEYDALPKGAQYIKDGKVMVKG